MKIKSGFELLNVCGENVVIAHGRENMNFSKAVNLNESAAYLFQKLKDFDSDFSTDDAAELLLEEYDVDFEVARKDAAELLNDWQNIGLIQ